MTFLFYGVRCDNSIGFSIFGYEFWNLSKLAVTELDLKNNATSLSISIHNLTSEGKKCNHE